MMPRFVVLSFVLLASCAGATSTTTETAPSSAQGSTPNVGPPDSGGATSVVSGSFGGVYEVPVPASLASAASYDMDEVDWIVVNGTARLHYKLPRALVGTSISVNFEGPYDGKAERVALSGEAGTADCTVTRTEIACYEEMYGLLPIKADMAVVEKLASGQSGSPHDRVAVSQRFVVDPIGIAKLDLQRASTPSDANIDHGDDK